MKSCKISLKDTERFDRDEFFGHVYLLEDSKLGFGALEVYVNGSHPKKIVEVSTRMYRVEEGEGTFRIDGVSYEAEVGDLFLIHKGSNYSYEGKMKLFEVNLR